jgi:hypothetical protein
MRVEVAAVPCCKGWQSGTTDPLHDAVLWKTAVDEALRLRTLDNLPELSVIALEVGEDEQAALCEFEAVAAAPAAPASDHLSKRASAPPLSPDVERSAVSAAAYHLLIGALGCCCITPARVVKAEPLRLFAM